MVAAAHPKRFEVYRVCLDPSVGSKMRKTRPGVVLSPDELNGSLRTVLVAPLTSTLRPYPFRPTVEVGARAGRSPWIICASWTNPAWAGAWRRCHRPSRTRCWRSCAKCSRPDLPAGPRPPGRGEDAGERSGAWACDVLVVRGFAFDPHGDEEPCDKLKRALRAEIDEAAWSSLYGTVSRPFDPPRPARWP
jgi:mRNA-degrading endonuclease toxin of MazEF toxin-antitoxin module